MLTNQSAVARGFLSEEELGELHEHMLRQMHAAGGDLEGIYYCPHHPEGIVRFEGRESRLGGERTGPWSFWYADGAIREHGTYTAGRRSGVWTQWHPNGQIAERGERRYAEATDSSPRSMVQPPADRSAEASESSKACSTVRSGSPSISRMRPL